MPVIRDINLKWETKEVLRREGFTGYASARPEIKDLTILNPSRFGIIKSVIITDGDVCPIFIKPSYPSLAYSKVIPVPKSLK